LKVTLPVSARQFFASSLTGIFVCVFIYSIILTSGKTSSLLYIPFIIFYFFFLKRKESTLTGTKQIHTTSHTLIYGYTALISLALYSLYCYANIDGAWHFRPVEADNYSYAQLSQYLNRGFENIEFSANFAKECKYHPYHYFEIWFNAMLYKVLGLNAVWTYSFILPTIFYTIIFWGLMSIVENYRKLNYFCVIICFILLFTTEISIILTKLGHNYFPYPNQFCSALIQPKSAPISLFCLALFLLIINQKYIEASLIALSLPVISFFSAPVFFALSGYIVIKDYFVRKCFRWQYVIPFLVMLLIFGYYVLSGDKQITEKNDVPIEAFKWRLFITNPISFCIRYIFPLAIIFLLNYKQCVRFCKQYFVEIMLFFFISTAFNVLLSPTIPNAVQFTSVFYYGVFNIVFPCFILFLYNSLKISKMKRNIIIFLFILGYTINTVAIMSFFSNNRHLSSQTQIAYEDKVFSELKSNSKDIRIGIISPDKISEWSKMNQSGQNYLVSFIDSYMNNIIYYNLSIGTYGYQVETAFTFSFKNNKNNLQTIDEFRLDFIQQNKINYLIVQSEAVIPNNLSDKLSLIATNSDTDEWVYKVISSIEY
jgi:hypothetical protein